MSPQATFGAGSAPLPPLPDFPQGGTPPAGNQDAMKALVSGVAPVKTAVDGILAACQSIARSGVIPGSEQVCGQIVALATSLLPKAAQQVLQPGGGSGGPAPLKSPGV